MWCSTTAAFPLRGGHRAMAGWSVREVLDWLLQTSSIPEMLQVLRKTGVSHASTFGEHLPCERPHGQSSTVPFLHEDDLKMKLLFGPNHGLVSERAGNRSHMSFSCALTA